MNFDEFSLKRTIFEIRYSVGSFAFFGRAGPLLDDHLSRFDKFEGGNDFLRVSRERNRLTVLVGLTRSAIDAQRLDVDIDLDEFSGEVADIIGTAVTRFNRPLAARLGFRCVYLRNYQEFQEPMQLLRDGNPGILPGVFPGVGFEIIDVGAAVVFQTDDHHRLHLSIGPYSKAELTSKLPIQEDDFLPEAAIGIDADYGTRAGPRAILEEGLLRGNFTAENAGRALRAFITRGHSIIRQVASSVVTNIVSAGG